MKKLHLPLLLVVLALVASSCFKANIGVEVEDDGSGTIDIIAAVDPDQFGGMGAMFGEAFGEEGGDLPSDEEMRQEICSDFEEENTEEEFDGLDDVTVEPYDEDGFCGSRITGSFSSIDQFNEMMAEDNEDEFVIERDGDNWEFRADLAIEEEAGMSTGSGEEDPFGDAFAEQMLAGFEFTVAIKLPGRQVDHNADEITSDGTLVWNIGFDQDANLYARTEPGDVITGDGSAGDVAGDSDDDGGFSIVALIVIVVIIAAIIGAVVYFRNKGKSDSDSDDPGNPLAPAGGPESSLPPPTS